MTDARNSLIIESASSLIFISCVGPPLKEFCPGLSVKSWLRSEKRLADETACRKSDGNFMETSRIDVPVSKIWTSF